MFSKSEKFSYFGKKTLNLSIDAVHMCQYFVKILYLIDSFAVVPSVRMYLNHYFFVSLIKKNKANVRKKNFRSHEAFSDTPHWASTPITTFCEEFKNVLGIYGSSCIILKLKYFFWLKK